MGETNRVQEAIQKIEENNLMEVLKQCGSIKDRYDKLMELLPGTWLWDPITARQLVFYLQRAYKVDFGVCDFYTMKGDRQYCTVDGEEVECLCAIPTPYCCFRDKDGKPKYPEFLVVELVQRAEDYRDALQILGKIRGSTAK